MPRVTEVTTVTRTTTEAGNEVEAVEVETMGAVEDEACMVEEEVLDVGEVEDEVAEDEVVEEEMEEEEMVEVIVVKVVVVIVVKVVEGEEVTTIIGGKVLWLLLLVLYLY